MNEFFVKNLKLIFLSIFAIAVTFYTLPFFGTADMSSWMTNAAVNLEYGPIKAYTVYNMYYPPLSSAIIWMTAKISGISYQKSWLDDYPSIIEVGDEYMPIKYSILFFTILSIIFLQRYIGKKLTTRFTESMIWVFLNPGMIWVSLILSYIDIYIVPTLILSLYFIGKKMNFLSGCMLTLTFLIKLIPIFLIPAFLAFYIQLIFKPFKFRLNYRSMLWFMAGAIITFLVVFTYYSRQEFAHIIDMSSRHGIYLNFNAMNIHWLIRQYFITTNVAPHKLILLSKVLFFVISGFLLFNQLLQKDKNLGLLKSCLGILFTYTMFFTGAHENHIFSTFILSLLLYFKYPSKYHKSLYFNLSLILFLNLFLFYRFGQGSPLSQLDFLSTNTSLRIFLITISTIYTILVYKYHLYLEYLEIRDSLSRKELFSQVDKKNC